MFEKLIATFIGKKIVNKLGLEEADKMDDTKPKWKSKAVWAAVLMAVVGAIEPISTALGHPVHVPQWVIEVLAGLGLYGLRDAKQPLA